MVLRRQNINTLEKNVTMYGSEDGMPPSGDRNDYTLMAEIARDEKRPPGDPNPHRSGNIPKDSYLNPNNR